VKKKRAGKKDGGKSTREKHVDNIRTPNIEISMGDKALFCIKFGFHCHKSFHAKILV